MSGRWRVVFTKGAEADLASLNRFLRRRIIGKLYWLEENFDTITPLVLAGEFKGFYKLRVGDWRVIYQIDWKRQILLVCYIDRRDRIYRRRK